MEIFTVALALPSGDASGLAEKVEAHPLLEACGVARTPEDLWRLVRRFRPDMLLISVQMLLELDEDASEPCAREALIPTLLVQEGGPPTVDASFSQLFRGPFAFCGTLDPERTDTEGLYRRIRERAELLRRMALHGPSPGMKRESSSSGLIVLAGGKGGAGNTLLAAALAACFAMREKRVLLLDLDRGRSQLSMLKPEGSGKNLVDLLPVAEDMSWEMARVSIYRHPSGFRLLPFGNLRRREGEGSPRIPASFFRNLNFLFDKVVVDLPGHLAEEFLSSLIPCHVLAVVTVPDALSARSARLLVQTLRALGADPRSLRLILNRIGGNSALQPHEISRALGIESVFSVPDDPRSGLDFAELGRLPRPESPLGKAAARLTAFLDGKGEHLPPADRRRGLLTGFRKEKPSAPPLRAGG